MEFETFEQLDKYSKTFKTFKDGEYAKAGGVWYCYSKENDLWVKVSGDCKINLYEINKTLVSSYPVHTKEQILGDAKIINDFIKHMKDEQHFMLLCRDINYYTIFERYTGESIQEIKELTHLGEEVIACISNVGSILSVNPTKDTSVEIWVRTPEEENIVMYLFPYDVGVVYFI